MKKEIKKTNADFLPKDIKSTELKSFKAGGYELNKYRRDDCNCITECRDFICDAKKPPFGPNGKYSIGGHDPEGSC